MFKLFTNYRDILASVLELGVIPALWAMHGYGFLALNEQVIGATIVVWSLVAQFYFRKATSDEGEK